MEYILIVAGIFVLGFGGLIWGFIHDHNVLKSGKGLIDDVPPDKEEYATIIDKVSGIEQMGVQRPHHKIEFVVKFRYDNGENITLEVPPELYNRLIVGMRDKLVTQNNNFVDFGGLVGENIS